jgi:hypothetical protein
LGAIGTGLLAGGGSAITPKATPFTAGINYQPVQLQQQITPPQKDYNRELLAMIERLRNGTGGMFT